jgi:hypothetical protein
MKGKRQRESVRRSNIQRGKERRRGKRGDIEGKERVSRIGERKMEETERRDKGERQEERRRKRYKSERRKTKNTEGKESWREIL